MTPYQQDMLDVLRRIAERGKKHAEKHLGEDAYSDHMIDLWVHLLDELSRLKASD